MTEVEATNAICTAWVAAWPAASGGVAYSLPNDAVILSTDAYAALRLQPSISTQRTHGRVGNRRVERRGTVQVKLWTPAGQGVMRDPSEIIAGAPLKIAELADAVRLVLELKSFGPAGADPVLIEAGASTPIVIDGRWAMCLVNLPYGYWEIR
jgi:hypothetical protein